MPDMDNVATDVASAPVESREDPLFRVAALSSIGAPMAAALGRRGWLLPGAVDTGPGMIRHHVAAAAAADTVIVRSDMTVDASLVDQLPRLRLVIRAGAGRDNIDGELLKARSVELVVIGGEPSARSVAEYVLWAVIGLRRRFFSGALREAVPWEKDRHIGRELDGARVAVWGYGNLGSAIAEILSPFGVEINVLNLPSRRPTPHPQRSLEQLAAWADTHVLALPLTAATAGIFDLGIAHALRDRSPVVVNVGRWALVDAPAMTEALRRGWISGLAVDPVERAHLAIVANWLAIHPNVVATPHLGAQTSNAQGRVGQRVLAILEGRYRSGAASPAGAA